jgi:hypothetical protein
MERIERNVRDIDQLDRHVLEHVVGQALRDNQRLIIQIAEFDLARETPPTNAEQPQTLADWTTVYEGLSDEQVEAVDETIKTRANLMRDLR